MLSAGVRVTEHLVERGRERGVPPYEIRKAVRRATWLGDGNYITQHGCVVIKDDAAVTVLATSQLPVRNTLRCYQVG